MENINQNKKFAFLCIGFVLAITYVFCLTFGHIPTENREMANVILGIILGVCIKDAYSYLFGSTEGSQKKDATIAQAQQNISDAIAATSPQAIEEPTLSWMGSFTSNPTTTTIGNAYVNTTDKKCYYWNGTSWIETKQKP